MKIENIYYFVLGILTLHEDLMLISAKSVTITATDKSVATDFANYMNCSQKHAPSECLARTGVTSCNFVCFKCAKLSIIIFRS